MLRTRVFNLGLSFGLIGKWHTDAFALHSPEFDSR